MLVSSMLIDTVMLLPTLLTKTALERCETVLWMGSYLLQLLYLFSSMECKWLLF